MQENSVKVVSSGGLGLESMGFITFIVLMILKLTGPLANVSWFWVTFPLWVPIAFGLAIWLIAILILVIIGIIVNARDY